MEPLKKEDKPRLFPEYFKIGKFSGSPRDFEKGKISFPRGGEDWLEIWYTDDPEENEYMDKDFQANVEWKINKMKKEGWDPSKQNFLATTQSHLDLGWMWRFRQGVGKVERTFKKVHRHFKLFPPFTFSGSQPAMYNWVKYNSPEIFEMVKEDVASGRHELQGGCWSEADVRMPSGEALVRQRLYGQLFYAKNFGKIANVSWFPDTFGYADNLPQIFAKSGATGFMTSKLTSNKQTKWPFWAWIWEAPEGTQLISYLTGNHNKLGPLGGYDVRQSDSDVRESYLNSYRLLKPGTKLTIDYNMDKPEEHENVSDEQLPFIGCFFGEGDGGHGPQGVEMATYRGFEERGHVKWMSCSEIFDEIAKFKDRLPIWKDELYYQYHRGSLTTQTMMKRMNRLLEWNLPALEGLCTLVNTLGNHNTYNTPINSLNDFYKGEKDQIVTADNAIEQIWQNTLLMQFHDVFPGTSVSEVYDECYEIWYQDLQLFDRIKYEALSNIEDSMKIFLPDSLRVKLENGGGNLVYFPYMIINTTGSSGPQLNAFSTSLMDFELPLAFYTKIGEKSIYKPIQVVKGDLYGYDFDKKRDRYIFSIDCNEWSYKMGWLICTGRIPDKNMDKELAEKQSILCGEDICNYNKLHETEDTISITNKEQIIIISKDTGMLTNFKLGEKELVKNPWGLKFYKDDPNREACWNLMNEWWNSPLDKLVKSTKVKIISEGPVQCRVRVNLDIGESTKGIVDYIITEGFPGVGVEISFDFHETETLVKYKMPTTLKTEFSVAETPYCTATRKNIPIANHDKARWEKWMHTFVLTEDNEENIGLAVINNGKYGFDTIDGDLGISIQKGPKYPGLNVVAWAKDERKYRKDQGLGEPPTHTDQGESMARLWILPYEGTWQDGKIHRYAHQFNVTPFAQFTKQFNDHNFNIPDFSKNSFENLNMLLDEKNYIPPYELQFLKSMNQSIEITVLKNHEDLPECLMNENKPSKNAIILRIVNNSNKPQETQIVINNLIKKKVSSIIEVDLLERDIKNIEAVDLNRLVFKPHEIKTIKLS